MTASPSLEPVAREIFAASAGESGPLAVRIVRKNRGGLSMMSVECLGHPAQVRGEGLFFSIVSRLDLFEENTFVDFGDVEALHQHLRTLAQQGLGLVGQAPGKDDVPASVPALELAADLATWRRALELGEIPTLFDVLKDLSRGSQPHGLDLAAIVQAAAFGRLAAVPAEARWSGALRTFFSQVDQLMQERDREWRASFMSARREASEAMQAAEREVKRIGEALAVIEGGSCNPDAAYLVNALTQARERVTKLRAAEEKAQRAGQLAMWNAKRAERARLYGPPAASPPAPAAAPAPELPPAA